MGSLRTLFALIVVIGHASGSAWIFAIGGKHAVQLFFIISGFLMSYILVERKTYKSLKVFYINRCLRLYPIYLVVACVTLIAYLVANPGFFSFYKNIPIAAKSLLIFSNMFIFGQDFALSLGIRNNALICNLNQNGMLTTGMLIPPAWTLGIELVFYLIAPFVLKKLSYIFYFLAGSLILSAGLFIFGIGRNGAMLYSFFPAVLAFFLLGALCHQLLMPFYKRIMPVNLINKAAIYATVILFIFFITFPLMMPLRELFQSLLLFPLFLLSLPLIFIFQSKFSFDNKIGELSYPIYICHWFVIWAVYVLFKKSNINSIMLTVVTSVIFSVLFAHILNITIGRKVELLRLRFKKS